MVAKLIARGGDREAALSRLVELISATNVAGPRTNGAFLRDLLSLDDVKRGTVDTGLIAREIDRLGKGPRRDDAVAMGVKSLLGDRSPKAGPAAHVSPWDARDAFQLGGARCLSQPVVVDGEVVAVAVRWKSGGEADVSWRDEAGEQRKPAQRIVCTRDGSRVLVVADLIQTEIEWPAYDASEADDDGGHSIRAPINGRVAKVLVAEGDGVEKGARIAIVEAMKMEHVVVAARAGRIAKISVSEGDQVAQGALVAALEEDA